MPMRVRRGDYVENLVTDRRMWRRGTKVGATLAAGNIAYFIFFGFIKLAYLDTLSYARAPGLWCDARFQSPSLLQ